MILQPHEWRWVVKRASFACMALGLALLLAGCGEGQVKPDTAVYYYRVETGNPSNLRRMPRGLYIIKESPLRPIASGEEGLLLFYADGWTNHWDGNPEQQLIEPHCTAPGGGECDAN